MSTNQNSLLLPKDQATGQVMESVVTESDLVDKSLLLLQGIPSGGVFDLNPETFTFSLNGN